MTQKRLSDQETSQRVLAAAVKLVHRRGLSTGLEGISFDEVIRQAGVSRTSAYRRWPSRDQFYGAVLLELASATALPTAGSAVTGPAAQVVLDHAEKLHTPEGHRDLVVELLRVSVSNDYQTVSTSPEWRTFTTLLASYQGITNPDIRQSVAEALIEAEARSTAIRARAYAQFTALVGYRLTSPLAGPDGFDLMSAAAGTMMTGLLTKQNLSTAQPPQQMRAFGSTQLGGWTHPVYMITGTVLSYVEPDPGIQWTPQRIEDLIAAITNYTST